MQSGKALAQSHIWDLLSLSIVLCSQAHFASRDYVFPVSWFSFPHSCFCFGKFFTSSVSQRCPLVHCRTCPSLPPCSTFLCLFWHCCPLATPLHTCSHLQIFEIFQVLFLATAKSGLDPILTAPPFWLPLHQENEPYEDCLKPACLLTPVTFFGTFWY